jgi:predicted  nucleic acid-binding Zn-ribbon protein
MMQKKLQKELSASQEANSRLEEAVVQLESRALHLQDQMEQQRSALTGSGRVHP